MPVLAQRLGRHYTLLALAFPMILANISQPLLGLVDTAVLGHLGAPEYLAGTAVGAFLISQLYWLCGFFRQSMTGLSAQSKGASQQSKQFTGYWDDLTRALLFAISVGLLLVALQYPILHVLQGFTDLPPLAATSLATYFDIRIMNAPVALLNLVTIGYLVGQHRTKAVLLLQVGINCLNILLNLIFVYGFDLGVAGVAYATVIAEWSMLVWSLYWILKHTQQLTCTHWVSAPKNTLSWCIYVLRTTDLLSPTALKISAFKRIVSLNRDLFFRSLMLQCCLAFLTYQGARFGVAAAAVNAILMQFFILIALGLDGIAYAIEAMIGESHGETKDPTKISVALWRDIKISLLWSSIVGVITMLKMAIGYAFFVSMLTNQESVLNAAQPYYWVMVVLPFVAHWCYCLDGVYIGFTRGDVMRNSMFISAVFGFFGTYLVFGYLFAFTNMTLWMALLGLQTTRGLTLGWHLYHMPKASD